MKRVLPTLVATLLFCGLLAFVVWGPKQGAGTGETKPAQPEIISLKNTEVRQIEVKSPDFTLALEKAQVQDGDKTKEVWRFTKLEGVDVALDQASPDEADINSFAFLCCPLRAKQKIAEKAADLAPYGLDKPRWVVSLNGQQVLEIGAKNEAVQGVYARVKGSDTVWLIENGVVNALPQTGREWLAEKK
jgi:hypothetical protein